MEMTNDEILRSFKSSARPREQVAILAQLNACSEDHICSVLSEAGVDWRALPRKRGPKPAKTQIKSGALIAVMRDEEKSLMAQKQRLPEQIAALQAELDGID